MSVSWGGDRNYSGGISKGVIYDEDLSNGVAWDGLVSVSGNPGNSSFFTGFFDGETYLNTTEPGLYNFNISALSFPESKKNLLGIIEDEFAPGIYVSEQDRSLCGVSYRTETMTGYVIHIVKNAMLFLESEDYSTKSNSVKFSEMKFSLYTFEIGDYVKIPSSSKNINLIEEHLYGSSVRVPSIPEL